MLARLMVAVRGAGLGVRASGDGLPRVAGAGCPALRQQREASTAEVSGAWRLVVDPLPAGGQREVLHLEQLSITLLECVEDEIV